MPNRYNWMADTDEKALQALIEIQRNIPPGDKLAQVVQMSKMMIRTIEDRIRRDHPAASEREVMLRAAAERLGREAVIQVCGWDPEGE